MQTNLPHKKIAVIILKSTFSSLTSEEKEKLSQYLNACEANQKKYKELRDAGQLEKKLTHYTDRNENQDIHFQTILNRVYEKP